MADAESVQAVRVHRFASFFKHYMGVSTIVTAALPLPIAEFRLIPVFDSTRHFLGVYTSLFAFLAFAFCFYIRHTYGRAMFGESPSDRLVANTDLQELRLEVRQGIKRGFLTMLPLLLIFSALFCVYEYHAHLSFTVGKWGGPALKTTEALKDAPFDWVGREDPLLMVYYFGIFLSAELAFVLMAMKEYLLDLLSISDADLITPQKLPAATVSAPGDYRNERG